MMYRPLKNEKGLLTVDFVFASLLVFALSAVIFSFGMTLSVVEVVQYMSYASARNFSLAHINANEQENRGRQKFAELATNPIFNTMVEIGWFEVGEVQIGNFNDEFGPDSSFDSDNFIGARIAFGAPILYKRIPLVGSTGSDSNAFQTNVQSFLAREPTFEECQQFMSQRAQEMSNRGYGFLDVNSVSIIMDNGC
jgi:hypothetical protein